jgi:hypothetical protein
MFISLFCIIGILRVVLLMYESFAGVWFGVTRIASPIIIVVWCSMDLRLTCELWRWRLEAKANFKQKSAAGTRYHSSLRGLMHEARIMYWLFLVLFRFGIDSLHWHLRRSLPTGLSTSIINWAFFLFGTNHKFRSCFIKIEGLGVVRAAVLFGCQECTFLLLN